MERILKAAGLSPGRPVRRVPGVVWAAEARGSALLDGARAEAAALLEAAAAESVALRRAAEQAGRADGLARAAAAWVAAERARVAGLEAAAGEALDLAVDLARRLLGRELRLDPAAVRAAAAEALAAAKGRRSALLRLHPEAAARLGGEVEALGASAALEGLELVADASLAPGDAVVETSGGVADGRLEVRLEALRRALAEPAGAPGPGGGAGAQPPGRWAAPAAGAPSEEGP